MFVGFANKTYLCYTKQLELVATEIQQKIMETLISKMREAVSNKTAQVLTLENAKALQGKRIQTIYFGYRNQDGADDFIVGEIVDTTKFFGNQNPEYINEYKQRHGEVLELTTAEGKQTYMRAHAENKGIFTCSDIDRYVFFIQVDEN